MFERVVGSNESILQNCIAEYRTQDPPKNIIRVSSDPNFQEQVTDVHNKLVVIAFDGSPYELNLFIQKQAKHNLDVMFLLVDRDLCPHTTKSFKITTVPSFVFQKNSYIFEIVVGVNKTILTNCISEYRTQDPPENVIRVTGDTEFQYKLNGVIDTLVVICFDGSWCEQNMFVHKQAKENSDVMFLLVDRNQCTRTTQSYKISTVPSFVFQKNKYKFESVVGANKSVLSDCISDYRILAAPTNIIRVTEDADFQEKLKDNQNKLVVIVFDASWCEQNMFIQRRAREYLDVMFLLVDWDECKRIAQSFKITSVPSFVFQKKNFKFESFVGNNKSVLESCLTEYRSKEPPLNIIRVINDEDFKEKMKANQDKLVVIDFDASWCEQNKFIQKQATDYSGVMFLLVDRDQCKNTAGSFKITALPTFVFQKSNFKFETVVDASKSKLMNCIAIYQSQDPPLNIVRVIDDTDFQKQLKDAQKKLIVIVFDASDCEQNAFIQKQAKEHLEVTFLLVDKDACQATAQSFSIGAVPAIVIQKNNNKLESFIDVTDEWLNSNIKKHNK